VAHVSDASSQRDEPHSVARACAVALGATQLLVAAIALHLREGCDGLGPDRVEREDLSAACRGERSGALEGHADAAREAHAAAQPAAASLTLEEQLLAREAREGKKRLRVFYIEDEEASLEKSVGAQQRDERFKMRKMMQPPPRR